MRICLVNVSKWIEDFHDLWFGMMISMKTAEMSVDLKQGIGLPFTSLPLPPQADVDRVRRDFGLLD